MVGLDHRADVSLEGSVKRHCMLLIDDRRDALFPLEAMLRALGQDVIVATNGKTGLELARQYCPDVVLCDIGLPDIDGYAVARAIRSDDALRSLLLVALTGYGEDEDRQCALDAGFDHHITKPISKQALVDLLRSSSPPKCSSFSSTAS